MREYLKVKIKSLAAESRIIRLEEKKAKSRRRRDLRFGLYEHRIFTVRRAARAANLAYGFIRGNSYILMEKNSRTQPSWKEISILLKRYAEQNVHNSAKDLLEEGKSVWRTRRLSPS